MGSALISRGLQKPDVDTDVDAARLGACATKNGFSSIATCSMWGGLPGLRWTSSPAVRLQAKGRRGRRLRTRGSAPLYAEPQELSYSFLRASIGEIDAARRAGMTAAKNADIASVAAATAKANGSQLETS
jgi:hypothetical protein